MNDVVRSYAAFGCHLASTGTPNRWGGVHGHDCACLACADYRARPVVLVAAPHLVPVESYERRSALRLGLSVEEYQRRIHSGQRWCYGHKDWESLAAFGRDARNRDGIAGACSDFMTGRMRRLRERRRQEAS